TPTRPPIAPGAGTGRGKAARAGIMVAGVRGSASTMKAITWARAIVAKGSGMRDIGWARASEAIARIPRRAGALVVGDRAARPEKVSRPAGPGSRWRRISSLRPDRSRELSPWDRMKGEVRIDCGDHRVTASGLPRTQRCSWRPPRREGFPQGGSAIAYVHLLSRVRSSRTAPDDVDCSPS